MRLARGLPVFAALLLVCGSLIASSAPSAPRVAYHPEGNFTRLVLDAPSLNSFSASSSGKTLNVRLEPFTVSATSGSSDTPHLAGWRLSSQGKSGVLSLQSKITLGKGTYKVFELAAGGGQLKRLVVDIGAQLSLNSASTTKAQARTVSAQTPKKPRLTVVLDPGHGGIDPGAVGYVTEKITTLDVALKVRSLLQDAGVNVLMTRSGDYAWQGNNGCDKRCDLDNRANMGSTDRNAFVSIHVNSTIGSRAQGIETYLFGRSPDSETLAQAERENGGGSVGRAITAQARNVARDLLNDQLAQLNASFSRRLANAIQVNLISQTRAVNLGVKQAEFWVIRKPRIPAVLVEMGFATHPVEGRNLGTQAYRQRVAQGIARGILAFLGL
jgi:N-acetylmuramoyl-L-alanine amidase